MRRVLLFLTLIGAMLLAFSGVLLAKQSSSERSAPAGQIASAHLAPPGDAQPLCSQPETPNKARCLSEVLTNTKTALESATPDVVPSGYWPTDLQSAYKLPSSTAGSGETVAIVDAFDNPSAESDLQTYRNQFGLPECTSANGCFKKVDQRGGTSYPAFNKGWAGEIALDLDMVSAVCPNCHILLVEADNDIADNLLAAEDEAANLGANAINNSWGAKESDIGSTEPSLESFFDHPGIAITASAGDSGYGDVEYPATSRFVTAAGVPLY
jgi:subtilase family serine protease